MNPTKEQVIALETVTDGKNLKLNAFAGAGKTSTLIMMAEKLGDKQGVYLAFKSLQNERNISMLGSVIGAEGAILSVLLSISFMKKSNEKTLDASVLPYLSVKKDTIPSEHAYAFEYFKIRKDKTDFDGWRKFDFDTISNDKIIYF